MYKENKKKEVKIGYEIRTIHNLIGTHVKFHMNQIMPELTPMQTWIIGYLDGRTGMETYQKNIEEEFDISRATATNLLQLMEKKNLIIRQPVAHDKRLKKIILTQKAMDCQEKAKLDMQRTEEILTQGMSGAEIAQLKCLLVQMHKNIARKNEEDA